MKNWSIKNILIVLLGSACFFLLLHALGVFRYSGGASDSYQEHAAKRSAAVKKAPAWNIAFTGPTSNLIASKTLQGIRFAITMINESGGILGKPVNLQLYESRQDFSENALIVQELCEKEDTALLLGPWNTAELLPLRAITQFQALPSLSITLAYDLPPLNPELHLSVLPPLSLWVDPILQALQAENYKKVLILGPEKIHYGGVFASHLERVMGQRGFFTEVFRNDYVSPVQAQTLHNALKLYRENKHLDALIFTGNADTLQHLGASMRDLDLHIPVIGTDLLDIPNLQEYKGSYFPAGLSYPASTGTMLDADMKKAWLQKHTTPPDLWEQYGILSMLLFRDALQSNGAYEPGALVKSMQQHWREYMEKKHPAVKVEIKELR